LAFALHWAGTLQQLCREEQAVQREAEAQSALTTEQGFSDWLAWGTMLRGWALAMQGQGEEGIVQLRQGLAAQRAKGAEIAWPYFLSLLAEAHGKVGQAEEGLNALAEALAVVDKTGERVWEAELYRLKGELSLQSTQFTARQDQSEAQSLEREAEECFQKAIAIAQQQQAKSLELRAVMSLSRLWQQQSKKKEAHQMLSEIYNWFTEGFDTKDLQEAKALLAELTEER
jgi:predicted ATPase